MAKFILSVGDGTFKLLESEAKRRDVTVQQLLRAVIVPEWVRENTETIPSAMPSREIPSHITRYAAYSDRQDTVIPTPVNRLRT